MRYAIISDIHANAQAWEVVSRDLDAQSIDVILCLGDIVGYGPRPQEVLDLVREKTPHIILGNHDAVAGGVLDPVEFNDRARKIIEWTCDQLDDEAEEFFAETPYLIKDEVDSILCTHAEVIEPASWGYILDEEAAEANFKACKEQLIFFGHSHFPGAFIRDKKGKIEKREPGAILVEKGKRYLVNPGSIGDPRTTDVRASYVIFDSEKCSIRFRQLAFDTEAYRKDLETTGIDMKPWFLAYLDGETSHGTPQADDAISKPVLVASRAAAPKPMLMSQGRRLSVAPNQTGAGRPPSAPRSVPSKEKSILPLLLLLLPVLIGFMALGSYLLLRTPEGPAKISNVSPSRKGETAEPPTEATSTPPQAEVVTSTYNPSVGDIILADFEGADYEDWTAEGTAMGVGPVPASTTTHKNQVQGGIGESHVNTYVPDGDRSRGKLTSPPFTIERPYLHFLIAGGNIPGKTCVNLLVDGQVVQSATGQSEALGGVEPLRWRSWDLSKLQGQAAQLEVVDAHRGGWGHVIFDHPYLSNEKRAVTPEVVSAPTAKPGTPASVDKTPTTEPAPNDTETFILPTTEAGKQTWFARQGTPDSRDWFKKSGGGQGFTASKDAPFTGGPDWKDKILCIRRGFTLNEVPKEIWVRALVDDQAIIYINGVYASQFPAYTNEKYVHQKITSEAHATLRSGPNIISVKAVNTSGAKAIDVGLLIPGKDSGPVSPPPPPPPKSLTQVDLLPFSTPNRTVSWRYTFKDPGPGWETPEFNDRKWKIGGGNFNSKAPANFHQTKTNGKAVWIRRSFTLKELPTTAQLTIHHDDDVETYLNGARQYVTKGSKKGAVFPITEKKVNAFRTGSNVLAAHCLNTGKDHFVSINLRGGFESQPAYVFKDLPVPLAKLRGEDGVIRLHRGKFRVGNIEDLTLSSAAPPEKHGAKPHLAVGAANKANTVNNRVLLRFDLSFVSGLEANFAGDAELVLQTVNQRDADGRTFYLYPVLPANAGWKEGQADWIAGSAGKPWEGGNGLGLKAGVGFAKAPMSSTVWRKGEPLRFKVRAKFLNYWKENPNTNAGVLILADERRASYLQFASSEDANPAKRPRLEFGVR